MAKKKVRSRPRARVDARFETRIRRRSRTRFALLLFPVAPCVILPHD